MADHTKSGTERKALSGDQDRLEVGIREQVRTWIEADRGGGTGGGVGRGEFGPGGGHAGGATGTGRGGGR